MAANTRGYPLLSSLNPEVAEVARLLWDQIYGLRDDLAAAQAATAQAVLDTQTVVIQAQQPTVYIGGGGGGGPATAAASAPEETMLKIDSVAVPVAEGVLLDGSALLEPGRIYQVTFEVVNIDGSVAVSVNIGVDVGASGSLAAVEHFMFGEPIPATGTSGKRTLTISADDDIRGVAGAAGDAVIWFNEVKEIG